MTAHISDPCPFCALSRERIVISNETAIVIRDAVPVSPGRTLIIPNGHVATFFETTAEERLAMFELMDNVKCELDTNFRSAAYNIGINDGPPTGPTVSHLHIDLIPRYAGDDADPRGGVRRTFPKKANYW